MAKNTKPAIRFKGFTDAWEQRKLGDVFEEYSEKGHEELPALTIIQGGGTIRRDSSDRSLQYDKASLSNYKKVEAGDFIVHLRSFEGGLEMATDLGIISPAYHTFHGEGTDSRFYYSYFRSSKFINQDLKPHVYGIRDGRSIDIQGMKTIEIPWSSFDEQKAIGDYIENLDRLITLHQRKYDSLVNVKKAMLEKMFPKNGETVPEIRFKGFTDAWEQRKVGELIEDYIEKTIVQNQYPVLTSSQQQGIVFQEEYFADRQVTTNDNIGYYVLPYGYFTYRSRSDTDIFVFNRNTLINKGIISYYYPVFYPKKCNSNFLLRRLNYGIRKQLSMAAEGTGQKVLAHNKFKNMVVDVPKLNEQERIGSLFSNLDNLITLHQRKLEKLKNIKKSCLEKMFV